MFAQFVMCIIIAEMMYNFFHTKLKKIHAFCMQYVIWNGGPWKYPHY
jgi:hypothetical protein